MTTQASPLLPRDEFSGKTIIELYKLWRQAKDNPERRKDIVGAMWPQAKNYAARVATEYCRDGLHSMSAKQSAIDNFGLKFLNILEKAEQSDPTGKLMDIFTGGYLQQAIRNYIHTYIQTESRKVNKKYMPAYGWGGGEDGKDTLFSRAIKNHDLSATRHVDAPCPADYEIMVDRMVDKLRFLNTRDLIILQRRAEGETLKEVSGLLGITQPRVRQIQEKAVSKVQEYLGSLVKEYRTNGQGQLTDESDVFLSSVLKEAISEALKQREIQQRVVAR